MTIHHIHIVHFGMLSDFSLKLEKNLHIIEGENETGKSTISAFIRFMLYGLDIKDVASCNRSINRQSGTAEGEMTVDVKAGRFRVERKCVKTGTKDKPLFSDTCRIVNVATGEVEDNASPGELWLGFPRSIFRRLACFGQMTQSRVDTSSMRESIENLVFSGDEKINIKNATAHLAEERDRLLSVDKSEGEIADLEQGCEQLREELALAVEHNRHMLSIGAKLKRTRAQRAETEQTLRELSDLDACYRNTQLLIAFDKLREVRAKTNDVSNKLQTLRQDNSHMGFIPDAEYLTDLEVNRRLYLEAVKTKEHYEVALREVESAAVVEEEMQRHLQRTLRRGGEDEVLATAHAHHKTTWMARFWAIFCALAAISCVVGASLILPEYFKDGRFANALPWCLGLGVGFLLLAGLDVVLWIVVHSKAHAECHFCLDYGAHNHKELITRMRNITECRNKYADHIMELRATRQYLDKAIEGVAVARDALVATLRRCGTIVPEGEDVLVYTDKVEESIRNYLSLHAELREEKSRLDATASQLRDQLKGQNEAAIMEKVPEGSKEKMKDVNPAEIAGSIAAVKVRLKHLTQEEDLYASNLALLTEQAEDPAAIAEHLHDTEQQLKYCLELYKALDYALATFMDADDRLKARIAPRLAANALELVCAISGGKYDDLELGDDLSIKLKTKGESFATELLSGGTKDIAYVALRMAMINLVCREEFPPLCLDESFAYQDDTRALGIMKILKIQADKGMQNIIFTCRAREEILAHQVFGPGIGYSKLESPDGTSN